MRIVGGKLRGRTLCDFGKIDVRPTSDKTRESLFNILRERVEGCRFLDLFGGTGAMGIEAFSRGAAKVVINDGSYDSVKLIQKNLQKLGIGGRIEVLRCDYRACLSRLSDKFDVIFIDPPYKSGLDKDAVSRALPVLADGGIIVLESENEFTDTIDGCEISDRRKYGRNRLTFFRKIKRSGACVFAGSFDPFTVGHKAIVDQCVKRYEKTLIVIGENPIKTPFFGLNERREIISLSVAEEASIKIICYKDVKDGYAEILKTEGVTDYIRGIRTENDMAFERVNEEKNKAVYPWINTVYLKAADQFVSVSSSEIKERIKAGLPAEQFIPQGAREYFKEIIKHGKK